ncbi:hypothetical protein QOZ80_1AG0031860 [Eleusine coracana subsp. coracana]|nr:hypothetical protein QOZ80_1AG0031860 [Eleusine coracana subsp. coracana]
MEELRRLVCLQVAAVSCWALLLAVARGEPQVPCYFIFGDSLVDNGNNNYIVSLARANYPPYGIDFAGGPSGRFTNGLTTVDVIAQLLGFDNFIPPFAGTSGDQILNGANFASAAAGIRAETGQQLGGRIPFAGQVQNYQTAVQTMVNILGDEDTASERLSKCIFSVGMGSNDYLNNYFMPAFYNTGSRYTPEQFAELAHRRLPAVPAGALQLRRAQGGDDRGGPGRVQPQRAGTVQPRRQHLRRAHRQRHPHLQPPTRRPRRRVQRAARRALYRTSTRTTSSVTSSPTPQSYGFSVTNAGCCGVGRNNGQVTCLPYQAPCANRDQHIFWDAFHPSEAANIIVGRRSYRAQSPNDAYPMDISTLASI